jgi:hypothetical protein
MNLLPGRNMILLFCSLALVVFGFIIMKLEPAAHGYGPWALTAAPVFIISGFAMGIVAIFYRSGLNAGAKGRRLFIFTGWGTFVISFAIYIITLEDTASLWDCAEFIACAYKLQVPHAPGAPLFLMIGRLFSLLAFGDQTSVAYWVNVTSALSSALAVMFAFWTVVMLARKIDPKAGDFSVIVSGLVGAFTIAFADSFWFSAVEAETYAMATLFLIIAFWAILKWEQRESLDGGTQWLIFIFYAFGLSVGVHPMSLLVLPALAIIVMFRYRKFSWKNLIIASGSGAAGILFLNQVILFGLPDAMKYFDIFFVNRLGMPFYSGVVVFCLLLVAAGILIYRWSIKRKQRVVSVFVVGMMYFLIGYSSYFMIIIRSQQNPSIDENNPEDLMSLASYLKRESYGGRPLVFGQNYTAKIESFDKGGAVYSKMEDGYEVTDYKTEYVYESRGTTILPRMYSSQSDHVSIYRQRTGLKEGQKPGLVDNLKFMFQYQFGHMYLRYLMFNFSGRDSDIQHAEWLSPLNAFGQVPRSVRSNPAHNNFLMLPLVLGIFGMFYQFRKDKAGFWAVMAFFLFLGLILVFYLNSPPNEPRERDYIYVGSYLAFALWCGLGAMGIIQFLSEKFTENPVVKYAGAATIFIPILMLIVGFDDHDRSGRSIQVDHARNTLASCAPDAILFTGGDNDTFPLWYVQEVEGFRTDVRVIVLSYFNGDWYIDQMQREMYDSEALPFSMQKENYRQGGLNDVLPYVENPNIRDAINLEKYLELVRTENRSLQVTMAGGTKYNSVPSKTFFLNVNRERVIGSGIVPVAFYDAIPEKLQIAWSGNYLEKSAFMALDLIVSNNWERPIYFNITSLNSIALDLQKHVLQEGQVYRLLPIQLEEQGGIDVDKMYQNLMEKAVFSDLDDHGVYYNHEDYQLRILQSTKSAYNVLAQALIGQHEEEKANAVMDFLLTHFVHENINPDFSLVRTTDILFNLNREEEGAGLADQLYDQAEEILTHYQTMEDMSSEEARIQLFVLRSLYDIGVKYQYSELAERCSSKFNQYVSLL